MKFLDQVKIYLKSGHGGPGAVSFRREKNIEYGGPNGGSGGGGGDVIFQAVEGLNTLIDFRYRQHFKAPAGNPGQGRDRSGANAESIIIQVPVGTQIYDEDRTQVLADLKSEGDEITLLKGGDGGRGNAAFKTSTNQSPRRNEPGWPGEELWVWLRLKLIADAGLVGFPNAGKSTFLAAVTRARPKIADYPFTTLHPNLGVATIRGKEFILADIPGLIEGAHEGRGVGDRFLGHIERCGVLLHLIDGTQDDVAQAYQAIRSELEAYGNGLDDKEEIIAITKSDALIDELIEEHVKNLRKVTDKPIFVISSLSNDGMSEVLAALWKNILRYKAISAGQIPVPLDAEDEDLDVGSDIPWSPLE